MKTNNSVTTYTAEDGATFLSLQDAEVHEAFLYVGKTIQAFGPEQVRAAVSAIDPLDPFFKQAICAIARVLRDVHEVIPVGPKTPRIDSVNAPNRIAVNSRASIEFEVSPAPTETPTPSDTPPVAPGDPETVTRPDTRPREPGSDDAGQRARQAVEGALFPPQTTIAGGNPDLVTDRQAAEDDALYGDGKTAGDLVDAENVDLPDENGHKLGSKLDNPEDEDGARGIMERLAKLSPRPSR